MRRIHIAASAAVALIGAGAAGAATFLGEFRVDVKTGPLSGGAYFGAFGYTLEEGPIPPVVGLDFLDFVFEGIAYTEEDDRDYPDFPRARFGFGGEFTGVDFIVDFNGEGGEGSSPGFRILEGEFTYTLASEGTPNSGVGVVTYFPVPGPGSGFALSAIALAGLARRRRRCRSDQGRR